MKLKENVSVIRSGGRDCNCVAPLEFQVWIEKLLGILKEAVEKNDTSDYNGLKKLKNMYVFLTCI